MSEEIVIKRIHFSVPEKLYNRAKEGKIFKNLDSIMGHLLDDYLDKMGY